MFLDLGVKDGSEKRIILDALIELRDHLADLFFGDAVYDPHGIVPVAGYF